MLKKIISVLIIGSLFSVSNEIKAQEVSDENFIQEATQKLNYIRHTLKSCTTENDIIESPIIDLVWSDKLKDIALYHANNMVKNNFFAHKDLEGNTIGNRAKNFGYQWQSIGENLAAGQTNLTEVLKDWMASPGHCKNLKNNHFNEFGLSMVKSDNLDNEYKIYWVLVLAKHK